MKDGTPEDWDDLASVTMIRDGKGAWNLYTSIDGGGTVTFPSLFPDPAEAIIRLGAFLSGNTYNANADEAEKRDCSQGIHDFNRKGLCRNCGHTRAEVSPPESADQTPSPVATPRPGQAAKQRRPARRKR